MKSKRLMCLVMALVMGIGGLFLTSGCAALMSPDQTAVIRDLEVQSDNMKQLLVVFTQIIKDTQEKIVSGDLSVEDGREAIHKIVAQKDLLTETLSGVAVAIAKAKALKVPLWAYLFYGVQTIATIGGSFFGANKIGFLLKAIGSLLRSGYANDSDGKFGKLMMAEIETTSGLTVAKLKSLHTRALDREI